MSKGTVRRDVGATLCDLCGEEIPENAPGESGSLTHGWLAHPITPETKHAWLRWPSGERLRTLPWEKRRLPENLTRTYDFHAECILRLVESNLHLGGKEASR